MAKREWGYSRQFFRSASSLCAVLYVGNERMSMSTNWSWDFSCLCAFFDYASARCATGIQFILSTRCHPHSLSHSLWPTENLTPSRPPWTVYHWQSLSTRIYVKDSREFSMHDIISRDTWRYFSRSHSCEKQQSRAKKPPSLKPGLASSHVNHWIVMEADKEELEGERERQLKEFK